MLPSARFLPLLQRSVFGTCTKSGKRLQQSISYTTAPVENIHPPAENVPVDEGSSTKSSSNWTGKNAWKAWSLGLTCSGLFGIGFAVALWGPPDKNEDGSTKEDEYSDRNPIIGYTLRAANSIMDFNQSIKDPVSEKLLPDPVKPPYYQPPYTLVLEVNGVLVHPDWKFRSGWRFQRRPALELFLQQLSPYYEVVAFSNESAMTGGPVLMQMDPQGQYIHYRLFRESTRYQNGQHIKDLSCLNRDLSRVVLIDWDPNAAKLQPRNSLIVKRWQGNENDRELIDLAAFLRMLAMGNVEDVRLVLDFYRESDDPMALFRERHEQLMEEQSRRKEEQEKKRALETTKPRFSFSGISRV